MSRSEDEAAPFVMPFGKHRGKPLDQVPAGYLMWVLENVTGMYPETREAITAYLGIEPLQPPAAGGPQEAQEERPPGPRHPGHRRLPPSPGAAAERATCGICGLRGTAERPLVHARCAADTEVPF